MALHQILHKVLTLSAVAAMTVLTSCEMDMDDISLPEGSLAGALKCVIDTDGAVTVYVTGSVSYADSALYSTLGETAVRMMVNGLGRAERTMPAGEIAVDMGCVKLAAGDEVTIDTESPSTGIAMSGTARVMTTVPIEEMKIRMDETDNTVHFSLRMTDDTSTDDFYQVEVHRTSFAEGVGTDTIMDCSYLSQAFSSYSSYGTARSIGLFTDERLNTAQDGTAISNTLVLSVPWDDLTRPITQGAADSMEIGVRLYHHSEDYYNFLSTANIASSYILLPVFGTTSISSNVTGGYGIVACLAYDERRMTMKREHAE